MLEAGSESAASMLNIVLKYLSARPDIQEQAYQELRSTGSSQSPTLSFKFNAPYTTAIIREILRLIPSTSIGIPHYTTEDVEYEGKIIPKNTIVVINSWSLFRDESKDPTAGAFRPERWLKENDHPREPPDSDSDSGYSSCGREKYDSEETSQGVRSSVRNTSTFDVERYIWGAGRRICPGMHLAENSLWLAIAKIIWAYKIEPGIGQPKGGSSANDFGDSAYEEGRITIPKVFPLRFLPRS
jgi:cytochrome P450